MNKDKLNLFTMSERIPHVRGMLNFEFTRNEYDKRVQDLVDNYSDDPIWGKAIKRTLGNIVPA